ncbi:MAG: hypothetical protein GXO33_05675 [Epsilonproteobacteria bacterium]|nr:hypothetical protein [Campylobacterota bacterium]
MLLLSVHDYMLGQEDLAVAATVCAQHSSSKHLCPTAESEHQVLHLLAFDLLTSTRLLYDLKEHDLLEGRFFQPLSTPFETPFKPPKA